MYRDHPVLPLLTHSFPPRRSSALVLLDRCGERLRPALTRRSPDGDGAVLVDGTLVAGGHAERFLTELPGLRLIGLDRDPDALWIAGERLTQFGDRKSTRLNSSN